MARTPWRLPILIIFIAASLQSEVVYGQEDHAAGKKHPNQRIGITIAHTHIPLGFVVGAKNKFLIVPTWGLSYDFRIAKRWSLGLHMELETGNYVVQHSEGFEIERESPFKIVLATMFNPWKSLVLEAGIGRELEKNASFWVFRVGAGYEIEMARNWDLAPAFFFDIKEDIYTSLTIGLQVGKKF